ncbi:MAG: tetratricopeptide repeat protein [Phycisphaeraceae bacterium]|nr:tetratricopeptide repeat protein [Phycisphaeraceae bacterium]
MGTEASDLAALQTAVSHYTAARYDQAEAIARRLSRRPEIGEQATLLLGKILMESGRAPQAIFELERLVKLSPGNVDALMSLHLAHVAARQVDKAIAVAERAYEASGRSDSVAASLGAFLVLEGRYTEAEVWHERARAANPVNGKAILGLARIYSATLRGPEAVSLLRRMKEQGVLGVGMFRHLAYYLRYASGSDPREMFELQKVAGALTAREADGMPPQLHIDRNPDRRLTIGYISPDFRVHACSHFMEPLFAARDREAFKVIAYSASIYKDAVTERFRKMADGWYDAATVSIPVLAKKIADDRVDIVFDLAGHTSGTKLACLALRPAPLTANYIGFPDSTGTPGIDFRMVDSITDPPGAEALATERLIRLDPCFLCYRPPADAPPVAPSPCEANGRITFGSFNAVDKISEATLDAWAEILKRVPDSRLFLKGIALGDPSVAQRAADHFQRRGVDPGRIELMARTKGLAEHLNAYGRMDIALDTFPYNGTTTTCEALWMGVPVVAFTGQVHASRVSASLLHAAGLSELVASDVAGYIDTAVRLASDPARIVAYRRGMRERVAASPLRDESAFMRRFESTLRSLWREWCAASM